jgi:glycosyltransferase involved in cell wall biosynthesis
LKKICILTQSHLCRNPRVVKEANSLANAGFEVVILTIFFSEELLQEDKSLIDSQRIQYIAPVSIIPSQTPILERLYIRLVRRIAIEFVVRLGLESPYGLGYGYKAYFQAALKIKADLYIAHQEMPTYVGCALIQLGRKVAFDFEDWYSVLLPHTESSRPVNLLKKIEATALHKGIFTFTTSNAMAKEMARMYQAPVPATLYNTFPWTERHKIDNKILDRKDLAKPSLIWFSQTIGPGRGLEVLIESLNHVTIPVELHLRGNCNPTYQLQLKDSFPYSKGHQLYFHELVSNEQLISRLTEHDIGLALEQQVPIGRDLTITNKILQYLLAGIAVVASGTKGQREVAEKAPESVFVFENGNALELAKSITILLEDTSLLNKAKESALQITQEYLCWEKQETKLLQAVEKCLIEESISI